MEMDAATGLATRSDEAPETSPVRPDGRANFVLPARGVAVAAFILAVACLGTLAIVADQNNADALSTIALALAVLAFSVQIIVYVAQAATSHQQMLRSEQLNTETSSLLVDVRGSADATQLLVREQFSNVLSAFIEGVNRTVEHKPDPQKKRRQLRKSRTPRRAPTKLRRSRDCSRMSDARSTLRQRAARRGSTGHSARRSCASFLRQSESCRPGPPKTRGVRPWRFTGGSTQKRR